MDNLTPEGKCTNNYNSTYQYRVQIGQFRTYNNAMELQLQLVMQGHLADIESLGKHYVIHVGKFPKLEDAILLERYLRNEGYITLIVAV